VANIQMSRRTIALVVAIVLAAVATVALVSYITSVKNKEIGKGQAVQVFVAKENIPAGTSGDDIISRGLIQQQTVPKVVVASGAIGSLSDIQGKVAAVNILQGEQIVLPRFVAPGQATQGGQLIAIPKGFQAISIEVSTVPGVSGFVQVGDRVSILAQLTIPTGTSPGPKVQFLLQNIQVLQIGRRVITQVNGQNQASTQNTGNSIDFTLAVSPTQAEKIAFANFQGELYFTLVPPNAPGAKTNGRTIKNAFS
jgi:pilus assembly protein CpaB